MLKNQWVNLAIWYWSAKICVVVAAGVYLIKVYSYYPPSVFWQALPWPAALGYAGVVMIILAAGEFSQSRYLLFQPYEKECGGTFDMVYVTQRTFWQHWGCALLTFIVKTSITFAELWLLGTFFPIKP